MKTIGIIGGAGFIGSYVTKQFLAAGYQVKVSATNIHQAERYAHLKTLPNAENLSLLPLKAENKAQMQAFVEGCELIVHGGTPLNLESKNPQSELLDPTLQGTANLLECISKSSTLEKVIFIASVVAYNTNFPFPPDGKIHEKDTVNEQDTPFMSEESTPYAKAKFLANQMVSDYIKNHPNMTVEVATVCPVWVVGNSLSQREDSSSIGMQFLFKNQIAPNPFVQMLYDTDAAFAMVDVEDVANAIFNISQTNGLHDKQYLLSSESWKVSDISAMLNQKTPAGKSFVFYENDLAKRDLGMRFDSVREVLQGFRG
ncbi:MAG: NAD-dependent epimerase/dehydratase family protein [Bacteroidota bacterium]